MGIFYFISPRVTRSLVYGLAARNRLDLYRPPSKSKRPKDGYRVVIYITGSYQHTSELPVGNSVERCLAMPHLLLYESCNRALALLEQLR